MRDSDEYESDSTVLVTDFASNPRKIDVKRRRLSRMQNSIQTDQQNNTALNDLTVNIQAESPRNKERDWRIDNYFSCINENSNNISNGALEHPSHSKTNDIVPHNLDNDMTRNETTNNAVNIVQNLVNNHTDRPKLKVLLPAAINARRATTNVFERNEMHNSRDVTQRREENKVRLTVLKPSTINARRATIHFDENNLESNTRNKINENIKSGNVENENNKEANGDSLEMKTSRLSQLHTASTKISEHNNVSGTRLETNDINSLPSTVTMPHNSDNIGDNMFKGDKDFRRDTAAACNNVSNVRKRIGNNKETQIEPKRIKTLLLSENIDENNENTNVSKICGQVGNEELAISDGNKAMNDKINKNSGGVKENKDNAGNQRCCDSSTHGLASASTARQKLALAIIEKRNQRPPLMCLPELRSPMQLQRDATAEVSTRDEKEVLTAKTFNKLCKDSDTNIAHKKQEGNILHEQETDQERIEIRDKQGKIHAKDIQVLCQVQDKQEASDPLGNHNTSKIQEVQNASTGPNNPGMRIIQEDNKTSKVKPLDDQSINTTCDQQQTNANQDEAINNENQKEQLSGDALDKTIASVTNEKQNTNASLRETCIADAEPETYKVQNNCQKLVMVPMVTMNKENTSKLDTAILSTTNDKQTDKVQNELGTAKVHHEQSTNEAYNKQVTNAPQDTQITPAAINTEDVSKGHTNNETSTVPPQETHQVSSEQISSEVIIEAARKVSINTGDGEERMQKFQQWFFTKIVENLTEMQNSLMDVNAESAMMLKDIIKTLNGVVDVLNESVETDVQYSCPKCGSVSNFSSSLLDTESFANSSKNCGFCCYIRKLYITYLKRHLNKKDRGDINKTNVKAFAENCGEQPGATTKIIPEEETCNDSVDKSGVQDCSSLTVGNTDNTTVAQKSSDKKRENDLAKDNRSENNKSCEENDVSNENKSENINSTRSKETDTNGKEMFDRDKSTKNETCGVQLTSSNTDDEVSTKNKLPISNKRANTEINDQVTNKRVKCAAENNNTEHDDNNQNVKAKDNSLHPNTVVQGYNSVVENSKIDNQSVGENTDSVDKLTNHLVTGKNNEIPETSLSSVVVAMHEARRPNLAASVNSELNTAKETSNVSPTETHTNTTSTNTQASLQPKNDNVGTAKTVTLKSKSDANSKEITNEIEIEESDKSKEKTREKPIKDTIQESNAPKTDADITNTDKDTRDSESILESLMNCFALIQNNIKKDTQIKSQKKDKPLPKLASNINSPGKSLSRGLTCNNIVVKQKYVCPDCGSIYTYAPKLLTHLKVKHNLEITKIPETSIRHQCPFCKKLLLKNYNKHVMHCSMQQQNSNGNKENNKGTEENEDKIRQGNIKTSESSGSTKLAYLCTVCNTTLTSGYADARLHRQHNHPEFNKRHILKRIELGDKEREVNDKVPDRLGKREVNLAQPNPEEDDVHTNTDEDNSSSTGCESEDEASYSTDICSINTTNSERSWKSNKYGDATCSEDERTCDSDASSLQSIELHEASDTSDEENNDRGDKIKNMTLRAKDTHNNRSNSSRNRNKHIFKCVLCNITLFSDYATRKHRAKQHPDMRGVSIFNKIEKSELNSNKAKSNRKKGKNVELNKNTRGDKASQTCIASRNTSDSDWSTGSDQDCLDERSSRDSSGQDTNNSEIEAGSEHSGSCVRNETDSEDEHYSNRTRRREERHNVRQTNKRQNSITTRALSDQIRLAVKEFVENGESNDIHSGNADENSVIEDSDSSDTWNTDTSDSNDDKDLKNDKEALQENDDNTFKLSNYSIKKKRQILLMLFGDDNVSGAVDGQQVTNENNEKEHSDNQIHSNEGTANQCRNEAHSDDDTIKVSENTIKKKKERMSVMFGDQDNNSVEELNISSKQPVIVNSGSNDVETTNSKDCRETHVKEPELTKNNNNLQKCANEPNQNTSDSDWSTGSDHDCLDERSSRDKNQQIQNKEAGSTELNCDMDSATDPNNSTKNNEEDTIVSKAKALSDEDRLEIDLINRVLEEYNALSPEDQQGSYIDDGKNDNPDIDSNVTNDQSDEASINTQASEANCLENIQIGDIRSIANKLIVFICQECSFTTDTYDDAIRHCQNHYNHIEDPVTYCQICQIKYETSFFERHKTSHDKYLVNIKIKFSYQWLFSIWQVFENNLISLRESEEIQVKSIFKTHCVKMSVTEDGPWQSALYTCAKCNACVPVADIEMHVQKKCTLTNYPCPLCDRKFLTLQMMKHHKIYHDGDTSQGFKTIVFNEEIDASFNAKLIKVKLQLAKDREKHNNIYKCMCGLCFNTLKKLKLHFVDCESEINDGVECTRCCSSRRFLPSDLDEHMSRHGFNEFKVKQITFKQEYDDISKLETITTESETQTESNDVKDELSQGATNIADQLFESTENSLQPMSYDNDSEQVSLSQNTKWENRDEATNDVPGDIDIRDNDMTVKRDLLKDESSSQYTRENSQADMETDTGENNPEDAQISTNNENINVARDILKHKLSQNSDDKNIQLGNSTTDIQNINEDLIIKNDMLKNESTSQSTVEEIDISTSVSRIEEDMNVKYDMLKEESQSEENIDAESHTTMSIGEVNDTDLKELSQENNEENIVRINVGEEDTGIKKVPIITIEDSDDDDIQFIG